MNVSCPDCRSIFRVDPAKVPPTGVRARCSVCSGVISIPAPSGQSTPPGGPRSVTSGSEAPPPERPRPSQSQSWDAPVGSAAPRGTPPAPAPRPTPVPAAPPPQRAEVPTTPRARPEAVERPAPTATATPPSSSSSLPERTPPPPTPTAGRPAPATRPPSAASAAPPPAPFVPSGTPARTPSAPPPRPPAAPPTAPQTSSDSGARRPLNPFLSKDPNQRAKRLARALVSDIITYHPAKHAEGLRDGTLKQLFREEIKKSFEEYIAQVGQQLAESTTYFQEALNEVLGAGKKIF
jgi:predicted Zn finger-like uncharacterized protein